MTFKKAFLIFFFVGVLPAALVIAGVSYFTLTTSEVDQQDASQEAVDEISVVEPYQSGESFVTYVTSEVIGDIAVRVSLPEEPRFEDGVPVIVYTPTFFTDTDSFEYIFDPTDHGFMLVSLLYPGRTDKRSGVASEGENDYGGSDSQQAFRDVILFALGEKEDVDGVFLNELVEAEVRYDNVGIYAFSHPGIMATNVMANYAEELSGVAYFVGRENPTVDAISSMELGYYDDNGESVVNDAYQYPENYSSEDLVMSYDNVRWAMKWERPYFDENENGSYEEGEYLLPSFGPGMYGDRYYSVELLEGLAMNEPSYEEYGIVGIPSIEEAREVWSQRESISSYSSFGELTETFRVMLVYGTKDHVQPTMDKPHVHQAYDGFTQAGVWIRLNPDEAYVFSVGEKFTEDYHELPANAEPDDWRNGLIFGHPDIGGGTTIYPLAAIAEMSDRTYYDEWSEDLTEVLQ